MTNFLFDLEQDPFSPAEFVERFAWRASNGALDTDTFDPQLLYDAFDQAIKSLKTIYDTHNKKCERFEMVCKEAEKKHWLKVAELQEKCKKAISIFQELDGHLDGVATKVVYLGDQLEGVNTPRARAEEAQKLMKQFSQFLNPDAATSTSASKTLPRSHSSQHFLNLNDLYEEADVIQKLHTISQELPSGGKFDAARKHISAKYDQIEKELIEEFCNAQQNDDKVHMREIAKILSHFKGYSQCIDAFIENSQSYCFGSRSIFSEILPLCQKSQVVVNEVFTNPDTVMSKFILNIYLRKLQEHIMHELSQSFSNSELYLKSLYDLYSSTIKISEQLAKLKIAGNDLTFLTKLTNKIFAEQLASYIDVETKTLKEKYNNILDRFYESKNHQKRPIPMGSIQELKRDIQVKIGRANINIGNLNLANLNIGSTDIASKETYLSEEVAINVIQETKDALQRCELLSKAPSNLPNNVILIFDIFLQYLCQEHMDYAIELGLISLSNSEAKSMQEVKFFEIVRQCNGIFHLFEKQFYSTILPMIINTPKHGECLKKKREMFEMLETKLNNGLEKSILSAISWIKNVLQNEQKKTDFKPENENVEFLPTNASNIVVKFLHHYVEQIRSSLDGKNVEAVLLDLGVRFHKLIYEHLLQFQYSSYGAMIVICDLNQYRRCAAEDFKISLINQLFDTLHALCNLLVVEPKNLKIVSSGDQLSGLDKSVLLNFVQLRSDYKSAKLNSQFK